MQGPFLTTKHFYPALQRSPNGKVINLSSNQASMSSLIGMLTSICSAVPPEKAKPTTLGADNRRGRNIGYRISKTALNQLTVSLGREFKSHDSNVTVNAIHPGWIPTTMTGFTGPDDMEVQTSLIVETIERLAPGETGRFMDAKGEDFAW